MTINKYLQQISPEDLAYVKRYHHEIQLSIPREIAHLNRSN